MARDKRSGPNVQTCTVTDARRHLDKAQQYLRSARQALEAYDSDAAAGNAVLAGINSGDAVSGIVNGNRWDGAHEGAARHVERAGPDGKAAARQLRKLIRKKSQAHYQTRPISTNEARDLVQAAERAVSAAERAIGRTAP